MLASCNQVVQHPQPEDKVQPASHEVRNLNSKEVPEQVLTLNTTSLKDGPESINDNLFGKFFCDRIEFYIIKNPTNEIYSSRPESITLSYIDGELRQSKYILDNNIVASLLDQLGSFKIKGLDFKNREIISSKQIVNKTKRGISLNRELDNYELKWEFEDSEIKYRVSPNPIEQYTYVEKAKNFEEEFKAIEKFCI